MSHASGEQGLVALFASGLFCFNVLTATLYPIGADVETLSGNPPLYSFLLSQWLKLTGSGAARVRSLDYFLISLAILAFWVALKRLQWLRNPLARLLFVGLAFLSSPLFYAYRVAGYDSLQILMTALLLLAWSLRAGNVRQILLFALGFMIAASGFQAVVYVGLLALMMLAWQRKDAFWPAGTLICGLLAGVVFCQSITGRIGVPLHLSDGGLSARIQRVLWSPLSDPGILSMMLILLLVLSQRSLCVWDRVAERLALAGLLCSYIVVVGLETAVHYTIDCHWMNQLILVGLVCAVLERVSATLSSARIVAILLIVGAALLLSIPRDIFLQHPLPGLERVTDRNEIRHHTPYIAPAASASTIIRATSCIL